MLDVERDSNDLAPTLLGPGAAAVSLDRRVTLYVVR